MSVAISACSCATSATVSTSSVRCSTASIAASFAPVCWAISTNASVSGITSTPKIRTAGNRVYCNQGDPRGGSKLQVSCVNETRPRHPYYTWGTPQAGKKMRKKRDYQAEYKRRIEKGLQRGYSRSQARGHARKGELGIRMQTILTHDPTRNALLKRIYKELDGENRTIAIELYKKASRDYWRDENGKRKAFRRRFSENEEPAAMDLLLLMLSDVHEDAQFGLAVSDPTAALMEEILSGQWLEDKLARKVAKTLAGYESDDEDGL